MKKRRLHTRVIVRPWVPRRIPYHVRKSTLDAILKDAYPQLEAILYVGWVRRTINGKRILLFLAATGKTPTEARKAFKTSEAFGENIWHIPS